VSDLLLINNDLNKENVNVYINLAKRILPIFFRNLLPLHCHYQC